MEDLYGIDLFVTDHQQLPKYRKKIKLALPQTQKRLKDWSNNQLKISFMIKKWWIIYSSLTPCVI